MTQHCRLSSEKRHLICSARLDNPVRQVNSSTGIAGGIILSARQQQIVFGRSTEGEPEPPFLSPAGKKKEKKNNL
jgi:hypothetical protein